MGAHIGNSSFDTEQQWVSNVSGACAPTRRKGRGYARNTSFGWTSARVA